MHIRRGASRYGCAPSVGGGLCVITSVDSVGGNRTWHDDDRSHLSLIQLDLSTKCPEGHDGVNQSLGVQFVDRAGFGDDIAIPKVCGKIRKTIKNVLKEAVTIPMNERHGTNTFGPFYPIGIIDEANKVHQYLMENWLRLIASADNGDYRVHLKTKTRKVSDINHGPDMCNGRLVSRFLRINDVHDILIGGSIFGS
jgi:hypothetical protein